METCSKCGELIRQDNGVMTGHASQGTTCFLCLHGQGHLNVIHVFQGHPMHYNGESMNLKMDFNAYQKRYG